MEVFRAEVLPSLYFPGAMRDDGWKRCKDKGAWVGSGRPAGSALRAQALRLALPRDGTEHLGARRVVQCILFRACADILNAFRVLP